MDLGAVKEQIPQHEGLGQIRSMGMLKPDYQQQF
jgi:hypothetical protein